MTRSLRVIPTITFHLVVLLALLFATLHSAYTQEQLTKEEVEQLRRLLKKQSSTDRLSDLPGDYENPLTIGGYGDIHYNFKQDSADTGQFDVHRLVFMVRYEFAENVTFMSETELEHAFVKDDDGEISIEQAYLEFGLTDATAIRAGRMLVPVGIINANHEPTTFNGVERPDVDKYLIPSTWSIDGIGVASQLSGDLSGELYVGGGLDGSKFSSTNGFRSGRIKERGSFREPMVTGRLDYAALRTEDPDFEHRLRIGLSGAYGGVDNSNQGGANDLNGEFSMLAADYDYRVGAWALRGQVVQTHLSGASEVSADTGDSIASGMLGWYQEVAYHYLPASKRGGRFDLVDANVFVRYEEFDTQADMPSGIDANGEGTRDTWTAGAQWWFTKHVAVKFDYQVRNDNSTDDLDDTFNLGIGFVF